MARDRKRVPLGDGGELSHNPFAAALGGVSAPAGEAEAFAPPAETPSEAPCLSQVEKVVLRVERKGHGGKTVTQIEGIDWSVEALEELAGRMKRSMGCGARVEQGILILQGDLRERARDWLSAEGAKRIV